MKFLKPNKVVILTNGKYAGKKAVIVKTFDEGSEKRPYPHALVVGIDRCPLPVYKGMTRQTINRRSRIRPFIKLVNYNHMMPTRYNLENLDLKSVFGDEPFRPEKRRKLKNKVKVILQERYNAGNNKWFFTKLRF